jgi:hypothetical protein
MTNLYKVLAQSYPNATTNTDLYTVGAGKSAVVSTISVCNITGSQQAFRIAIRPSGATLSNQHYIAYDSKVAGNDTNFITVGTTLAAGDVITVYVGAQSISFNVFGTEIS